MTFYPDLLRNFVYRQPQWRDVGTHAGIMDVVRFICSRDLLIAEVRLFKLPVIPIHCGLSAAHKRLQLPRIWTCIHLGLAHLPKGSDTLSVQLQWEKLCIWSCSKCA